MAFLGALALGTTAMVKPSLAASFRRSWPRGAGRTSPARPTSPKARNPLGRARPRRLEVMRSEEHTSELQSQSNLVCRLLLEKKKNNKHDIARSFPDIVSLCLNVSLQHRSALRTTMLRHRLLSQLPPRQSYHE